ncbi:MAG: bactofilin family protein [Candidatus Dormibacteraceae bacterium]
MAEAGGRHRNRDHGGSVVLGPRDSLTGKLHIEGDLRVQGSIEGELDATGEVHVDASATVKAAIQGRTVNVRGKVSGDVTAQDRLLLAGSAVISGDVRVARLAIEDGATLNGHVSMQPAGGGRDKEHGKKGEHEPEANGEAPAEEQPPQG